MLVSFLKQSWLVMVSALVFGLLVAGVHGALEGRIAEQNRSKLERKMKALLDDASSFGPVQNEQAQAGAPAALYYVAKDEAGTVVGYAIAASGGGFADKIELLVALDSDLTKLRGIAVLASNETPGFGDKIKDPSKNGHTSFKDQFIGCPVNAKLVVIKTGDIDIADEQIVSITGATISSEAVTKIVNEAVKRMKELLAKTGN